MARNSYSAEFKENSVLEVLREERSLEDIVAEKNMNPNMQRN